MKLLIDLPLRTTTTKISLDAYERWKMLAEKYGARQSDVISACLLHMPEKELAHILAEQKKAVDGLPKVVKGMLRNLDKLSDDEREMLRKLLS